MMKSIFRENPTVKFGNLEVGRIPRIVGIVHLKSELSQLTELVEKNIVDILELRADRLYEEGREVVRASLMEMKQHQLPIIATIREGEGYNFEEHERLELFRKLIPEVDAIDIELRTEIRDEVIKIAKLHDKSVIISEHNLTETPSDEEIEKLLSESLLSGVDITKIAAFANSADDIARLMCLTLKHSREHPLVTISLGDLGTISRTIAPLFGSCLSYGYIAEPVAPGQMSVSSLHAELKKYLGK
jgi:3-dehydroquinate dehydratase-1